MASVQKFAETAIVNLLRHNDRTIQAPSNPDIDFSRSNHNYSLIPERSMSSYDYYKQRKSELYCYNRHDVKVLAGWVVTAPKELAVVDREKFFQESHIFLSDRYGLENVVQSIVHQDEGGQPHLHFVFIPVTKDTNPKHKQTEKICANDVINRRELRNFHPDLQRHLNAKGINAVIISGITKLQGGNKSVRDLKCEREFKRKERSFGYKDRETERTF